MGKIITQSLRAQKCVLDFHEGKTKVYKAWYSW